MSYTEPLLNCDLEPSSVSPALTIYMPCSCFTSTFFLFSPTNTALEGIPGEAVSLPAALVFSGGGSEEGWR